VNLRYVVVAPTVVARSASTAGDPLPPFVLDTRCTFKAGAELPADIPIADLDRLLRAGKIRPVNR
jgi:hypothetical protein